MKENMSNVVLFSENLERIAQVEKFFNQHPEFRCSVDVCPIKTSTEDIFLRYTPKLILIDFPSLEGEQKEYLMSKLERVSETIPLIGMFDEIDKGEALNYVKRGIRDLIDLPMRENDLLKVLQRFNREITHDHIRKSGRVYTFFSFKGGVGNTFVCVNTAVSLAKNSKKRVLLWDMALQAGDIPFFLNYKPEYTLTDIVDNIDNIDESYVQGVLHPHSSGISILPSPAKIEEIERLRPDVIEKLLNIFLKYFDHIVIDGGYRLTDVLIPLIDSSSYLFVTCTLELISLRSASRCLDILDRLNYSSDKIKIVVNRFNSKHEAITVDKAREILKYDLVHFFGNDYEIATRSVNLGQAVCEVAKGSRLDKQFTEFSQKVQENFQEPKQTKKLFGKILNNPSKKAA